MRLPFWISGLIAGILFLILGAIIDNATVGTAVLQRLSDTFLIFGIITIVISIIVIVVQWAKNR